MMQCFSRVELGLLLGCAVLLHFVGAWACSFQSYIIRPSEVGEANPTVRACCAAEAELGALVLGPVGSPLSPRSSVADRRSQRCSSSHCRRWRRLPPASHDSNYRLAHPYLRGYLRCGFQVRLRVPRAVRYDRRHKYARAPAS